jgi:hypothetical protein
MVTAIGKDYDSKDPGDPRKLSSGYQDWTFVKNMLGGAPRPGGPGSIGLQTGKGMSRTAFRALVAGDVAWLLRQGSTPARDHILAVLQRCEAFFYPEPTAFTSTPIDATRAARASLAAPFTQRRTSQR